MIRLLFLLLLFFVAVKAEQSMVEKKIQQTVITYNHGIMKAARTANPDLLLKTCEREQYLLVTIWIKSWHDETVYMDSRLDTLEFKKFEQHENSAIVETDERWFFKYLFMKDKKELYPEREINYKIRYHLVFNELERRWKIKEIDILDEKSEVDDPKIWIQPMKNKKTSHQ